MVNIVKTEQEIVIRQFYQGRRFLNSKVMVCEIKDQSHAAFREDSTTYALVAFEDIPKDTIICAYVGKVS